MLKNKKLFQAHFVFIIKYKFRSVQAFKNVTVVTVAFWEPVMLVLLMGRCRNRAVETDLGGMVYVLSSLTKVLDI
jgi:hypothetical protein